MEEIEKLIRVVQTGPKGMIHFHAFLFENMVEKILVSEGNILVFKLVGGLELKEEIDRRKRR